MFKQEIRYSVKINDSNKKIYVLIWEDIIKIFFSPANNVGKINFLIYNQKNDYHI